MNTKLKYLALSLAGTTALFLGITKAASAITINPSGYTFINPSGAGYPDSGGELTDGIIATENWNTPDTFVNRLPYVGWIDVNPVINFTFDSTVNIDALTLSVDDSGGAGAVTPPASVNISMDGGTPISRSVTNPAGIEPFSDTFSGLGLSGTSLELEVVRAGQWTFLSEVSFESASVPFEFSPSLGLLTVGGIFGFTRLRKWKAVQKSIS